MRGDIERRVGAQRRRDVEGGKMGPARIELTEEERKFLDLFHKADTTKKIVIAAIMSSGGAEDGLDMLESCTRSDFKRAIKQLRVLQGKHPEYADLYEEAIGYIRRVWLHKEAQA